VFEVSAVGAGVLIPVMVEENAEARTDTNRESVIGTVPVSMVDKVVEQRIETLDRADVLSSGENSSPSSNQQQQV
jgi:hypothetical protein